MFAGEDLAVCMTGPNKKLAEVLASLLILDRLADNRPVVPQPPKIEPLAAKSAPAPAAPAKPAAKKPRRSLKQRFIDWFHRLGDAYTK